MVEIKPKMLVCADCGKKKPNHPGGLLWPEWTMWLCLGCAYARCERAERAEADRDRLAAVVEGVRGIVDGYAGLAITHPHISGWIADIRALIATPDESEER